MLEQCGVYGWIHWTFMSIRALAVLKKPLCTLHNANVGMMKKVVGGKYTTLKQKCTSISGKINKMAESP